MSKIYLYSSPRPHIIESIDKQYLYFSKPGYLNDPFDSNMELFNAYTEVQAIRANSFQPSGFTNSIDYIIDAAKEFGIRCFSKDKSSLHLWSLYSESHRGIALEFQQNMLQDYYSDLTLRDCSLVDVDYREAPINLDESIPWEGTRRLPLRRILSDPKEQDKLIKMLLLQKKKEIWQNEKEMRIIIPKHVVEILVRQWPEKNQICDNGYKLQFPDKALTGVYFGTNITSDYRQSVVKTIQSIGQKIPCYQASLDFRSWQITFDEYPI